MMHNSLEDNILLKECVQVLNARLLNESESEEVLEKFHALFPITKWGKIDWNKMSNKIDSGYNPQNIIPSLEKIINTPIDKSVYIAWSSDIPLVKTDLDSIINHFDDVTCVAFEKFIFNLSVGYIIEVLPSDKITIGFID